MAMTHPGCQSIGAGFFLFIALFSSATPVGQAQSPAHQVRAADIVIPPDIGYVIQTTEPTLSATQPEAPVVIHIHEAHVNIEAQRHIIAILEQLIQQHGLRLILLEGGEGDPSLSYLRAYGPLEDRKLVAERYLTKGLLTGVEYLDMVSDAPLILWGVERQALYKQHINTFVELEALQQRLKPAVQAAQEVARRLAPSLYEPALLELNDKAASFESETLSLADSAQFLSEHVTQAGLSLDTDAPQLATFVQLSRMERAAADPGALAKDPSYVSLRAQLEPAILSEQLDALIIRLRSRLALSAPSQRLQALQEEVELTAKLVEQRLSPSEYRRLRALTLPGLAQRWQTFFSDQCRLHNVPVPSFERLGTLEQTLPEFLGFYEIAAARDEALVANTLAKLRETGEPLAVLITGGFHAPQIGAQLTAAGLTIVSVVPKITTPTNERLYQAVLNYKHGRGTLEAVNAAVTSTQRGTTQ